MPELSDHAKNHVDLVGAYDERKRLFDRLRDLNLNDEDRKTAEADYLKAAANFDTLRSNVGKK